MTASTDDYVSLITPEHIDKPKFVAVVQALTQGPVDNINLMASLKDLYDLDQAVGQQLDAVGAWIGLSRYLSVPLTGVYFSWDSTALLGWDSGVWQGPNDPSTGLVSLPDDEYRQLLRAKIAANRWDGTMQQAEDIWNQVFGGSPLIIIQDRQDMTMIVGFVGQPLTAVQQALLTGGYFPLKPATVRVYYYAVPVDTGPIFAWDAAPNATLDGWDNGRWVQEIVPT